MRIFLILAASTLLAALPAHAGEATVAVASNFAAAARELAADFESSTGNRLRIVVASTGKLYAQIVNGAPFDIFLSADAARPERLEQQGLVVPGSRRAYALGRLVLWSRDPAAGRDCVAYLVRSERATVAIANPELAPYGLAARQYLESLGAWDSLEGRLVYGENVMQAFLFAARGGATFALTAASIVAAADASEASCSVMVPEESHEPVVQQYVQLERSAENAAARAFAAYLRSARARRLISAAGYALPAGE
jgi:molybdate transport system substrate-binding protein